MLFSLFPSAFREVIHGEGLTMVPLQYDPILPYLGTTVDPDPVLERIREHEKSP